MMRAGQAKGPSVAPPGSGGGTGNLSGTLTSGTVPIASGVHTLADSFITYAANLFTSAKAWLISGTLSVINAVSGANFGIVVANSSNTANSATIIDLIVGGASALEASVLFQGSGSTSRFGWDEQGQKMFLSMNGLTLANPAWVCDGSIYKVILPLVVGTSSRVTPVALTSVSNATAVDADLADLFTLTLGENSTLSNPTNPRVGRKFMVRVRQDGAGGRTLAYDTAYRFPSGSAPVVSANTAEVTYLGFIWNEDDSKWDNVGLSQPFLP